MEEITCNLINLINPINLINLITSTVGLFY